MSDNGEKRERSTVLICSAGTSPAPLIKSIDYHQPDYVIYMASKESREKIPEINRALSWKGIKDIEIIDISDPENIASSMKEIRLGLQKFLKLKNFPNNVCLDADITGGTKPMSAALSQVVTELVKCRIFYVGGTQRNPEERMIVVNGKEKFIHVDNPWEEMGYSQSRRLAYAFNARQFQAAEAEALFLKEKRASYELFYENLAAIIRAFSLWEKFDYRQAFNLLKPAMGQLRHYNNYNFPSFMTLYEKLNSASEVLSAVRDDALPLFDKKYPLLERTGQKYLRDLLSNARSCARDGRYDDAVARLYSVIEKSAKIALKQLGKDNSKLKLEDLREANEDFEEKYAADIYENGGGKEAKGAKLGLAESFRYLRAISPEHELAKIYFENEKEITNALEARNSSLLAHGFLPINKEHYEKLFYAALKLLDVKEEDLWDFPQIKLEEILV